MASGVLMDGLSNIMTGGGTTIDRRMSSVWLQNLLVQGEIENAYRGSWLTRKIVDVPAEDMTRAWRDWQADDAQIEKLETEEKRLHVRERIQQGIILGRLGGGLLVMGLGEDPASELDPESVTEGQLKYLYPVSRWNVKLGDPVTDPENPQFGEPETFGIQLAGKEINVHHSRVIVFRGKFSGKVSNLNINGSDFWGDSIVTIVDEAVKNATTVHNEIATLVSQAKIDIFKIPDFMANMGNPEYEERFLRRVELANLGKSNHRALLMDAGEEWEQRQLNLSGFAELAWTYMAIVSGAADIPATRLLGKAPDGMNATGEGDQDNYNQMVKSQQDNDLRPKLEKLDEVLVRSSLGSKPDEVYFEFAPLDVPSEKEAAEVENKEGDTLAKLVNTGLFQDEALEEAFSNRMVESGRWPGYEKARDDALAKAEQEPSPEDIAGVTVPGLPVPGQTPGVAVRQQPGNTPQAASS